MGKQPYIFLANICAMSVFWKLGSIKGSDTTVHEFFFKNHQTLLQQK